MCLQLRARELIIAEPTLSASELNQQAFTTSVRWIFPVVTDNDVCTVVAVTAVKIVATAVMFTKDWFSYACVEAMAGIPNQSGHIGNVILRGTVL